MDNLSNLLRIKDVADLLGVTTRTVYRRIWSGELPATKIGGLYYIKRTDLDALLNVATTPVRSAPPTALLKCASCLRVLVTRDQVAAQCAQPGCTLPICKDCAQKGIKTCREHSVAKEHEWSDALSAYQQGELSVLVKSSQARLREITYLNRIRTRITQIESLLHPQTGDLITIKDWEQTLEQGDERAEVLKLKGSVFLNSRDAAEYPLNARLTYHIPAADKQKSLPLEIQVRVLSHLEPIVKDGFDTRAFNQAELTKILMQLSQQIDDKNVFCVLVLAATTGWDASARQVIASPTPAEAFLHPRMLIYLYDLESNQLSYHQHDQRLVQYAQLFTPLLIPEEAVQAEEGIKKLLLERGHSSLTIGDALQALPYPEAVIREAYKNMAASGRYRLVELDDIGTAIQEK